MSNELKARLFDAHCELKQHRSKELIAAARMELVDAKLWGLFLSAYCQSENDNVDTYNKLSELRTMWRFSQVTIALTIKAEEQLIDEIREMYDVVMLDGDKDRLTFILDKIKSKKKSLSDVRFKLMELHTKSVILKGRLRKEYEDSLINVFKTKESRDVLILEFDKLFKESGSDSAINKCLQKEKERYNELEELERGCINE